MSTFERKVAGDALQLVGVVREYGPDAISRLFDEWGPDHTRAVCIALAAAVDPDRTVQELWGWLGPVSNRTAVTVRKDQLFNFRDPHTLTTREIHDMRPANHTNRRDRRLKRNERGAA